MTKPTAVEHPDARYKVRIIVDGFAIHAITRSEPVVQYPSPTTGDTIVADLDIINDTTEGDSLGYLDWSKVSAITWRAVGATDACP